MQMPAERVSVVEGRCSPFAAELLRELKRDAHFDELVAALEKIDGQIYRSDVEAVFALIRNTPQSPS